MGDSADGYPGVPGWGKVSAGAVLTRYGHLEDIPERVAHWDVHVRGARGFGGVVCASIASWRSSSASWRRWSTDVPLVTESLDDLRWRGAHRAAFEALAERLAAPDLIAASRAGPTSAVAMPRDVTTANGVLRGLARSGLWIAVPWFLALVAQANSALVFGWAGAGGFLVMTLLWVVAVGSSVVAAGAFLATHPDIGHWFLLVCFAWSALLIVNLLRLPIAGVIWIFYLGVLTVGWISAILVSLIAFRAAYVLPSAKLALAIVVLGAVGTIFAMTAPWNDAYAILVYRVHEAGYGQLATDARRGALAGDLADDRAAVLPAGLSDLSTSGRLLVAGACGGEPVLFAPIYFGIPDGAVGYINSSCSQEELNRSYLDGEGDDLYPRIYLGTGWWWAY